MSVGKSERERERGREREEERKRGREQEKEKREKEKKEKNKGSFGTKKRSTVLPRYSVSLPTMNTTLWGLVMLYRRSRVLRLSVSSGS